MVEWLLTHVEAVWAFLTSPAAHAFISENSAIYLPAAMVFAVMMLDVVIGVPQLIIYGVYRVASGGGDAHESGSSRQVAERLREESGARFAVLFAPIEGDRRGELADVVHLALERYAPAFLFDREVAIAKPDLALSGADSADEAREWSRRSDADLVLWGCWRRKDPLMRLYFLTAKARNEEGRAQEIRFMPPADFEERERLAAGVAYVFARTALPCADNADRYRPEKLMPVLEALDKLAADPPKGLGAVFEKVLREDAAKIALSVGRRLNDADTLRRASRLRLRILAEIDRDLDPRDWAKARLESGRAQLVLGRVEGDAKRLDSAIEAFVEAGEMLGGDSNRALRIDAMINLAEANRERAKMGDEPTYLNAAAKAYRAALNAAPDLDPRKADAARRGLAAALHGLADINGDDGALEQAVDVYRQAVNDRARAVAPLEWASAQHDLGVALTALAARSGDPKRYEEAVTAFRAALTERTRDAAPREWAETMNQVGHAYYSIGKTDPRNGAMAAAIAAFKEALEERTRDVAPLQWAQTQNNLGNAYQAVGEALGDRTQLKAAIAAYRAALEELDKETHAFEWAGTQNNLGNALHVLGEKTQNPDLLEDALEAHKAALSVRTRDAARVDWAATRNNMGLVLTTLGANLRDPARLREAVDAYRDALGVFRLAGAARYAQLAERNLGRAEELLNESQPAAE
jgi:tetratricopeptide (TPR) repeat protein